MRKVSRDIEGAMWWGSAHVVFKLPAIAACLRLIKTIEPNFLFVTISRRNDRGKPQRVRNCKFWTTWVFHAFLLFFLTFYTLNILLGIILRFSVPNVPCPNPTPTIIKPYPYNRLRPSNSGHLTEKRTRDHPIIVQVLQPPHHMKPTTTTPKEADKLKAVTLYWNC